MVDWRERSREELIIEVERLSLQNESLLRREESEAGRFRAFFEESYVPFWLEDWSFVAEYVHGLFDSGVHDLHAYFSQHPDSLASCLDMVRLVDANEATLRFFGLSQKTQMLSEWDKRITPWARRTFVEALTAFLVSGERKFRSETTLRDASAEIRRLLVQMHVPESHARTLAQVHISATDITEMRAVQAGLERRRKFERVIARLAGAFVFPEDLHAVINEALRELGRLSEASRAYLIVFDEGYNRVSEYYEWCAEGIASSRSHLIRLPLDDRPWYVARLLEDREVLIDDVSKLPPEAAAEKATFEAQGVRSLAAIPVFIGDRLEGAVGFDDVEQTHKWGEMALDQLRMFCGILGSAIHGRRKAEEVRVEKAKLEAVNERITATLARIVEARDVYTAGHQQRTSRLAENIALEMGLEGEDVEIVRMAALLHDIGKIVVPTEILNKPGHLSELEWNLIRIHPEEGASLLEDVPFHPDVAEAVRQHHERWDGSGYPRGLEREHILLYSRILAVADVVETMASHRPYRARKGLEEALREIETGRGKIYDPDVVDACLTLFRKKGYDLEQVKED